MSDWQIEATKIDLNNKALESKINSLLDEKTMTQIHNEFAKVLDPYVPFLEGPLSQTVQIYADHIKYVQPYAHYQYEGINFNHTTTYHPLATAQWDKVAMTNEMDKFEQSVRNILVRRAKELYG